MELEDGQVSRMELFRGCVGKSGFGRKPTPGVAPRFFVKDPQFSGGSPFCLCQGAHESHEYHESRCSPAVTPLDRTPGI